MAGDVARVLCDVAAVAEISDEGPGVTRVAYSTPDGDGRAWFAHRCAKLALRFEVDRFGNCFGWSRGSDSRPAVLLGSHLDSVREAGRYDGVLGVLIGFEMARSLLANDANAPLAVVAFACEESTRFGIGAVGSRLLVGDLGEEQLDELRDLDGMTLREVLAGAALDPTARSSFDPLRLAAFIEVHVDQGSGLGDCATVGIVPAIAGCIRTRIEWRGDVSHSGAHTRARRRNALLGAARFVVAAEDYWSELEQNGDEATITIGWLENRPNAANSVSGATDMVVDLRAPQAKVLDAAQTSLERFAREIGIEAGLDVHTAVLGRIEPVAMSPTVVSVLERAARDAKVEHRLFPSMAGHDAEVVAHRVPSAMLFVANPAGVSHSPEESINESSLAGVLTLLDHALPVLLAGEAGVLATTPGGTP